MYDGGWIKACSIGGEAEWKTNTAGQLVYDSNGNKVCEKFYLYEISIVTLPSNPDAVTKDQFAVKIYNKTELAAIHNSIVTLSSKYKLPGMEPVEQKKPADTTVEKTPEELAVEAAEKALLDAKTKRDAVRLGNNSPLDPSMGQLPGVIKEIVKNNHSLVEKMMDFFMGKKTEKATNETAPAPKGTPESKISDPTVPQPAPIGLSDKQTAAKKKAEESREAAEKACNEAASAKEKAEKEGASQEDKDDYAAKFATAEKACNEAVDAEAHFKSCMESDDMKAGADASGKVTNAAGGAQGTPAGQSAKAPEVVAPKKKTVAELKADQVNLAPKPERNAKVKMMAGTPFTKLRAKDNEEGNRIINRVATSDGGGKDITDYQIVLDSILCDGRYAALAEKTRVIVTGEQGFQSLRRDSMVKNRTGLSLQQLAAQLNSGRVEVMGRDGVLRETTTLSSTDNALASPALNTIEWLSLAIFTLFPTTDWKNDIPMFGAEMTSRNTGIIWANVAADPAIYFGTQPVTPADYTYNDTAVSLTLIPSWLQPMLWTPLTMHQLRYDQMATGWAQAFAKWGSLIDDKLIYTLASTVPVGSIINTIGQKGVNGPGASFTLTGVNDPNRFFYNPTLETTLATPAYNDITRIEQIYAQQNFDLDRERARLVIDPTMDAFIAQDPDTKSLLTRFIKSNEADVLNIRHTALNERSRVAIFDPVSGQVKDPAGAIPGTAVSAAVGFLPSQIGMGLGILDVFMIQSPTNYGYRMSADIREGIVPLRANFNGTTLYTYGTPVNP